MEITWEIGGTQIECWVGISDPIGDLQRYLEWRKIENVIGIYSDEIPIDREHTYESAVLQVLVADEEKLKNQFASFAIKDPDHLKPIHVLTEMRRLDERILIIPVAVFSWKPWNDIRKFWQGIQWMIGTSRGKLATNDRIEISTVVRITQVNSHQEELNIIHSCLDLMTTEKQRTATPRKSIGWRAK
jgi:hypothetical protein